MTSWFEEPPERKRDGFLGSLALALGLPILFVGGFFLLSALLEEIARWFA